MSVFCSYFLRMDCLCMLWFLLEICMVVLIDGGVDCCGFEIGLNLGLWLGRGLFDMMGLVVNLGLGWGVILGVSVGVIVIGWEVRMMLGVIWIVLCGLLFWIVFLMILLMICFGFSVVSIVVFLKFGLFYLWVFVVYWCVGLV